MSKKYIFLDSIYIVISDLLFVFLFFGIFEYMSIATINLTNMFPYEILTETQTRVTLFLYQHDGIVNISLLLFNLLLVLLMLLLRIKKKNENAVNIFHRIMFLQALILLIISTWAGAGFFMPFADL